MKDDVTSGIDRQLLKRSRRSLPRVAALASAIFAGAVCSTLAVADDAPAAPGSAQPAEPQAGPGGNGPDIAKQDAPESEEIQAAELKLSRAEVDYLQAKLDLAQLKGQTELAKLEEELEAAQATLLKRTPAIDEEGFIHTWLVAGPIKVDEKVSGHDEDSCREMLDRLYVPADATPRADDKATVDGKELTWKKEKVTDFALDLVKVAADASAEPEHAAFLGVVYIMSEHDAAGVKLSIGSDDDSVWRLNGREVIRAYEGRPVDKDQNQSDDLMLKKGVNVLTFTVLNGDGDCGAAARFITSDGDPVPGLTASLTPPK